jgi:hypothetical protein
VAATPGKTKHFQTLIVSEALLLCDCPGLVLPRYAQSKAEMVAAGATSRPHIQQECTSHGDALLCAACLSPGCTSELIKHSKHSITDAH